MEVSPLVPEAIGLGCCIVGTRVVIFVCLQDPIDIASWFFAGPAHLGTAYGLDARAEAVLLSCHIPAALHSAVQGGTRSRHVGEA